MGDFISRQAALDAFGLTEKSRKYGGDHSGYDTRMLYEIQDVLESLPSAEPEPKWIPVTEALPINGVDVIVSVLDDSGDTPYRFTSVGWCITNGQYWVVDNEMCYGVIAWMPIPKPVRGE